MRPESDMTTFGPIPQPISIFKRPFTSIMLFIPFYVFVTINDFYLDKQVMVIGLSFLFSRSKSTSSTTAVVPTDNFLTVSPVKQLII
jgi:hypothetical protein